MFLSPFEWLIFSRLHLIRKYSKYSLHLISDWECNDTPPLNNNGTFPLYVVKILSWSQEYIPRKFAR